MPRKGDADPDHPAYAGEVWARRHGVEVLSEAAPAAGVAR